MFVSSRTRISDKEARKELRIGNMASWKIEILKLKEGKRA